MLLHLIILNYNGRHLLAECLPSVVAAARASRHRCEVVVIDNDSADDSVVWLEEHYPEVRVVRRPNRGLSSYNEVVAGLPGPVAVLLNNDIKLDEHCLDPLVEPLLAAGRLLHDGPDVPAVRRHDLRGFSDGRRLAVGTGSRDGAVPGPRGGDRPAGLDRLGRRGDGRGPREIRRAGRFRSAVSAGPAGGPRLCLPGLPGRLPRPIRARGPGLAPRHGHLRRRLWPRGLRPAGAAEHAVVSVEEPASSAARRAAIDLPADPAGGRRPACARWSARVAAGPSSGRWSGLWRVSAGSAPRRIGPGETFVENATSSDASLRAAWRGRRATRWRRRTCMQRFPPTRPSRRLASRDENDLGNHLSPFAPRKIATCAERKATRGLSPSPRPSNSASTPSDLAMVRAARGRMACRGAGAARGCVRSI